MRTRHGPRRSTAFAFAVVPLLIAGCSAAIGTPPGSIPVVSPASAAADFATPIGTISVAPEPAAAQTTAAPSPALAASSSIPFAADVTASPAPTIAAGQAAATNAPRIIGPVPSFRPGMQPVAPGGGAPSLAPVRTGPVACTTFPATNVWNKPVNALPVASNSAAMVNAIGAGNYVHADFDAIGDGIPYNVVTSSTPAYSVSFDYADESDPGPYPIPASPLIEGGSDRHLLSIDLGRCKLWELYAVAKSGNGWTAGSGAVFDLRSNALRPAGWTSADAAGLPIFAGLVRYDEVRTGTINHALRFTASSTCGYIYPATHLTGTCSNRPPMGLRVRLKASVNISGFGANAQVVLRAMKTYGMILADNGSPWYISGAPDTRWNDDEFHLLQTLHGSDFEVVDTSGLRNG